MNRQYFVSYAVEIPESDESFFGWTVISRNKSIEAVEDLEDVQREIELSLWEELKCDVNVRLISWRRMEQE